MQRVSWVLTSAVFNSDVPVWTLACSVSGGWPFSEYVILIRPASRRSIFGFRASGGGDFTYLFDGETLIAGPLLGFRGTGMPDFWGLSILSG